MLGIFGRRFGTFATGAAIGLIASRVMAPLAGRAVGAARVAAGGDPFDALARDHQRVLSMMDSLLETDDTATMRRTAGLLQIKRALTAHALAEEDVVYPLLHDRANAKVAVEQLYREHAEIKMHLARMEHMQAGDPAWTQELQALRDLVARHARDEEEREFPRLREALAQSGEVGRVSQEIEREKQLVL